MSLEIPFQVLTHLRGRSQHRLPTATDIVTCISETDTWKKDRKALRLSAMQVSTDIRLTVGSWP